MIKVPEAWDPIPPEMTKDAVDPEAPPPPPQLAPEGGGTTFRYANGPWQRIGEG